MRSVNQTHSMYVTVGQQTPEHLFENLTIESIIGKEKQICFPSKKYGGRIFSGSD